MYLTLNTASMWYNSKLREGQRQTLTREGLFCIRKKRCLDPAKPPAAWKP